MLVLSFGSAILVGALLLMTSWSSTGESLSFIDALFTATSAVCVTGLIVVDTGKALSTFGQSVVLALIQLGGLGLMTYSSVFLLMLGKRISFKGQALIEETIGRKARYTTSRVIKDVFFFTLAIELAGAALLTISFSESLPFLTAFRHGLFHSISAFCNAGFSLYSDSLISYRGSWLVNATILTLIVTGGIGFTVLEDLADAWTDWRAGRAVRLQLHSKVVLSTTAILILAGTVGIWVFERGNALKGLGPGESFLACLFQSITARTAGFNTLDYAVLTNTTLFLSVLMMFIGASPGSCGGGVKTSTFAVVASLFKSRILAQGRVSLFKRTLPEHTVSRAVSILMASFVFVTVITFILLAAEIGPVPHHQGGGRFLELFFETVSAFGTVGLSTGITGGLSSFGKILLACVMFVGRIGPLTMALAIGKKEERGRFQYAEENLMVG